MKFIRKCDRDQLESYRTDTTCFRDGKIILLPDYGSYPVMMLEHYYNEMTLEDFEKVKTVDGYKEWLNDEN